MATSKKGNSDKYVAYVSSYTTSSGNNYGIRVYDVDMEAGRFTEKEKIEVTNSSYITISHNEKFLYSITDFGVEAYKIGKGGSLECISKAGINGMRGSYLSTDYTDSWLFVAGYHDGKITVLKLNEDGTIGQITDEVYHRGMGSVAERNYRPHVQCVKMTRDNKFLCAADLGLAHVSVYQFNHKTGKIKMVDTIHSELNSAPRHLKFTKDGKFLFIVNELKCTIDVYSYVAIEDDQPEFEKVQTISTLNDYHSQDAAASALNLSEDCQYIVSSTAGDNSVSIFKIYQETGELSKILCLPVSGDYPKDAALFPDDKHLVSLNHEANTMTFFNVDLEKGLIIMNGREMKVDQPNCIIFHKLTQNQK